jgi:ferredoxin-nitrite reductase
MEFLRPYRKTGELSQIERWKLDRNPLDVADAIIDTYASAGPAAIAAVPGEQERLKWVGLYPQRQGGDAFMMRVKSERRPSPRDRARGRRSRRGTGRQSGVR